MTDIKRATGSAQEFLTLTLELVTSSVDTSGQPIVSDASFFAAAPPEVIARSLEDRPEAKREVTKALYSALAERAVSFPDAISDTLTPEVLTAHIEFAINVSGANAKAIRNAITPSVWVTVLGQFVVWNIVNSGRAIAGHPSAFLLTLSGIDRLNVFTPTEKLTALDKELVIADLVKGSETELLGQIALNALRIGEAEQGRPFTAEAFLTLVTNVMLAKSMNPNVLYDKIVIPAARRLGVMPEPTADVVTIEDIDFGDSSDVSAAHPVVPPTMPPPAPPASVAPPAAPTSQRPSAAPRPSSASKHPGIELPNPPSKRPQQAYHRTTSDQSSKPSLALAPEEGDESLD